jgi:hypothetical protein
MSTSGLAWSGVRPGEGWLANLGGTWFGLIGQPA